MLSLVLMWLRVGGLLGQAVALGSVLLAVVVLRGAPEPPIRRARALAACGALLVAAAQTGSLVALAATFAAESIGALSHLAAGPCLARAHRPGARRGRALPAWAPPRPWVRRAPDRGDASARGHRRPLQPRDGTRRRQRLAPGGERAAPEPRPPPGSVASCAPRCCSCAPGTRSRRLAAAVLRAGRRGGGAARPHRQRARVRVHRATPAAAIGTSYGIMVLTKQSSSSAYPDPG